MTYWIGQELRGGFETKILVCWKSFGHFDFISDMISECFPWSMMAQCDGQLVKQMVEYDGRGARRVLRLHSERNFGSQLRANENLARCYEKLKGSYSRLDNELFRQDNFGGYRSLYVGDIEIPAKSILREGPLGHLAAVPEEVPLVSTVYLTSKQERGPYLMLGSFPFLNSDCHSSCRNNFDRTDKMVQLETLKRITLGDELLVKYSEEFFDDEKCLYATFTAKKVASDTFTPSKFSEHMTYQLETGSNVADETVTPVSIETSEKHIGEIVDDVALLTRKKSKKLLSSATVV